MASVIISLKPLLLLVLLLLASAAADLSVEQKQECLDTHNWLRRAVANGETVEGCTMDTAANMMPMEWDDRLAEGAQNFVSKCVCDRPHDENADRAVIGYSWVGQNAAWDSGNSRTMKDRIVSWFKECHDYTLSSNTCAPGKVCGHYTQVVWAKSRLVGCGFAVCPDCPVPNRLVCNYAFGGNYNGEKPYIAGSPASRCSPGYEMKQNGLCVRQDQGTSGAAQCSVDACQNGGARDGCGCKCPTGFAGLKCQDECHNNPTYDSACKSLASQGSLDCAAYSSICAASCDACSPTLQQDVAATNVDNVQLNLDAS